VYEETESPSPHERERVQIYPGTVNCDRRGGPIDKQCCSVCVCLLFQYVGAKKKLPSDGP
jgi:hypothetical protein